MKARKTTLAALLVFALAGTAVAQSRPDALQLYRQGRYEDAVEVTLAELEETPRNMNSYTVLGWSLLALGRYQDALDYGERALAISRYDSRIVQIVGESHYRLGNNVEALDYLQEYVAIAPTGDLIDQVYFFMGEVFMRLGEYNHADVAFSTAVYHNDGDARWWSRLGYARELAGDLPFAESAYQTALDLNSGLTEAQRGLDRIENQL
ncbi:MAG: tetratricopeptide repeat protein [Alkalispirochaetaceae bacterium]